MRNRKRERNLLPLTKIQVQVEVTLTNELYVF
jgi:hypothetical protein